MMLISDRQIILTLRKQYLLYVKSIKLRNIFKESDSMKDLSLRSQKDFSQDSFVSEFKRV